MAEWLTSMYSVTSHSWSCWKDAPKYWTTLASRETCFSSLISLRKSSWAFWSVLRIILMATGCNQSNDRLRGTPVSASQCLYWLSRRDKGRQRRCANASLETGRGWKRGSRALNEGVSHLDTVTNALDDAAKSTCPQLDLAAAPVKADAARTGAT